MKNVIVHTILVVLSFCCVEVIAQTMPKTPKRVYFETVYNGPYTNSTKYTSQLMVAYTDGTTGFADIQQIKATIPGAKKEYNAAANSFFRMIGWTFLLVVGALAVFVGLTFPFFESKRTNTIIGVAGAIALFFGWRGAARTARNKREHWDKFLDTCNAYYQNKLSNKG